MNRRNNLVSSAMPAGTGLEHRSSFDANSLHALRSSASEPSLTDATKSGPQRKSKQQLKRPSNRSPSLLSGPSQPSAGAHYGRTRKLNTKASSDLSDCCSDTNNAVPSPSPHIVPPHGSLLTSTTVRKRHLPPFAEVDNKWKDLFLATVTHALYISAQPFQDFTVSTPIMRSQIQRAIDLVYPEAAYSVKARGDPILLLSYNRLCELRAKIASDAVDLVVKHVRSFSSTTESHEWLLWARRLNGPLYFEDPTPAYCLSQRGSAGFIEPSGKLKSQFILTLVEHYLQFSQSAISDTSSFQPMVGLFGLVMAALERAVYIVRADAQLVANAKKFSHDNYGDKVDMFVQVVQGVSVDRWRELIEICSQEQTESDDDNAGPEAVGGGADHYNMFAFESPKKRRV
ncbi:hypothetical protein DFP72DRAFT_873927 [Ephemerocybe angulata]|uniref:Uncharacterized protein n=1 Tax=Ephemerocybe angulata TaxID=980116 RepID=A0A8H6MFY7_9AGAR|nr:hypothetical protein DFP72DRAFT_873927 [Tulosesus angulatus]